MRIATFLKLVTYDKSTNQTLWLLSLIVLLNKRTKSSTCLRIIREDLKNSVFQFCQLHINCKILLAELDVLTYFKVTLPFSTALNFSID